MNAHRSTRLPIFAVVVAALLAGCASTPSSPPTPITDVRQVEGKWQGTITLGGGGQELYYLTIQPDGTMIAQWGMNWQTGKLTLSGGTANFELNPPVSTGTLTYYAGPGRRSLWLFPTFGNWTANVSPGN